MEARAYPGKGLSLLQLAFAMNEELKRTAFSPLVNLDEVSQLDNDISVGLATIREWRNTFNRTNRLPFDILSLIPIHLPPHKDRFRASFVCRHWRRTFLRRAELWSDLDLTKGEDYVKTLLERAKGSQLFVLFRGHKMVPTSTMMLLSPHTNQIRDLVFVSRGWADILRFIDTNPGPFPLLDSLAFNTTSEDSDVMVCPTRLFGTAVNLREFYFYSTSVSTWSPSLGHFVFPNLTLFDFVVQQSEDFRALRLFDFLEASPMLQTVRMSIVANISLDGIPQERVVTLPNVKDLDIIVTDCGPGYEIITYISCPSIASMSFMLQGDPETMVLEEIFPTPALWNAIIRRYARSPVEEITLLLNILARVTCTLTLRSSDGTAIGLSLGVKAYNGVRDEVHHQVFTEATSSILYHPQLANVKRFRICHSYEYISPAFTPRIANESGRLFKSLGPLDELTIYRCDVKPYFLFFLGILEGRIEAPAVFSPIKQLTISHPMCPSVEEFRAAVVGLAHLRHALGVPFERVIIRAGGLPAGLEEELRPWVGSAEYCYEDPHGDH